jgi:soluble lytic murein transglycosylase
MLWGQIPRSLGQSYREAPSLARRQALERFAAAHRDSNGALADLTLGVVSYEQKQYADAIHHVQRAQSRLPQIADYTSYYLASARVEVGDDALAARDAAAARSVGLRSPLSAKSLVVEARGLAGSGSAEQAIRLLEEHDAELPQPDGALTLASAYESAHDLPHAVQFYQRVYDEYPDTDQAARAAASLATLKRSLGAAFREPAPAELVERANRLLLQHEYQHARSEFESLVPQLTGPDRDAALVGIGAAEFLKGEVSAAYSYLWKLDIGAGEAGSERLYYLVECARKLNDDDEMMDAIQQLANHHADSLWRYRALVSAASHFLVANQHDKYVSLYRAVYESFPGLQLAPSSHWHVAWDAYLHRKHDARELLAEQLERYPAHPSASAALYFLGRLSESENDAGAARAFYTKASTQFPNYYYGLLARDRLAQPQIAAAVASAKTAQFLATVAFPARKAKISAQPDSESSLRIARARLLASAGLTDLANEELRFGAQTGSQPYLLAMELAAHAATPHERLHDIKTSAPDYLAMSLDDAPSAFWRLLFPLPFQKDLVTIARKQGLDPYMVAALVRQESEFNPQALSPKQAYGLTQVVPGTGRALARRVGVRRFTNRSLFQPALNLRLGTAYLRILLDEWGGRWEPALASYNAGKSRVTDWLGWNRYQDPAEFVESIPFTETREYVQAILRNAAVYRQLYGVSPATNPPAKRTARPARSSNPA